MTKSIFDREIFFKLETIANPFIAARAISQRARMLNTNQRQQEKLEETVTATTSALNEYLEGRIDFSTSQKNKSASQ